LIIDDAEEGNVPKLPRKNDESDDEALDEKEYQTETESLRRSA
jgi:hypothetical protein